MISSVSFNGQTSATFSDVINRPQAYKTTPSAAAEIGKDTYGKKAKKKHGFLKTLVVAAGLFALAGVSRNKGWTAKIAEKMPKLGNALDKVGEYAIKSKDFIVKKFNAFKDRLAQGAKETEPVVEEFVDAL